MTKISWVFSARERNLLQQRSKRNMYNNLHYLHNDIKNHNKNLLLVSILRMAFLLKISGGKFKNITNSISLPLQTHIWVFYLLTRHPKIFVKNFHGIAAADVYWYFVNELGNGIPSLPLPTGTSEDNTHYMLVSIGAARLSKNGPFRLLNENISDLISKFKLMEKCE